MRLALIPTRADAEGGPPAGQYVERGDGLDQVAGMAVVDARDQRAQAGAFGDGRQIGEGAVALQHWLVEVAHIAVELEEVIHDPDAGEAGGVGGAADLGQLGADGGVAARPGEAGNL